MIFHPKIHTQLIGKWEERIQAYYNQKASFKKKDPMHPLKKNKTSRKRKEYKKEDTMGYKSSEIFRK